MDSARMEEPPMEVASEWTKTKNSDGFSFSSREVCWFAKVTSEQGQSQPTSIKFKIHTCKIGKKHHRCEAPLVGIGLLKTQCNHMKLLELLCLAFTCMIALHIHAHQRLLVRRCRILLGISAARTCNPITCSADQCPCPITHLVILNRSFILQH